MSHFLPTWLIPLLPEAVEPHRLTLVDDVLTVITPEGEASTYADLKAVRDDTHGADLTIDKAVFEKFGSEGMDDFGLFFPVSEHFSGMLMSYTDEDRRKGLERDFEHALANSIRYEANPNDFYNSYYFIDTHPAFWTHHQDWYWHTSGHCERLSQYVSKSEDGRLVVGFETGQHVEPEFKTHYHDYRLDVYGESFEDAFIKLAALVAKFFHSDGTEKEDVEHEKPEWILELERRVEESNKWLEEERDELGES